MDPKIRMAHSIVRFPWARYGNDPGKIELPYTNKIEYALNFLYAYKTGIVYLTQSYANLRFVPQNAFILGGQH